jgi:hypothetical protein
MQRWPLLAVFVLSSCSKPKEVTVDELGVTLTVPGGWDVKKHGDNDVAISSGGLDGVILRRESKPVTTLAEGHEALIVGYKLREEKPLPKGGFLFDYDVDFGTAEKPMLLRMITTFLTTPTGTVSCQLQLQADQDPAPIVAACTSMHASRR